MTAPYYSDELVTLYLGDCLDVLRELPANSVDAVVTDPPYSLAFMSREWDTHATPAAFQQWCELWAAECLRVLKPGGHMLSFGGTRTWHRLVCAIEDAGFEIRDSIAWLYSQGFPKSMNVSANPMFCQCDPIDWKHGPEARMDTSEQVGGVGLPGVRGGISSVTDQTKGEQTPGMLAPMSGQAGRRPIGTDSTNGAEWVGDRASASLWGGESSVEGWSDTPAREGQLRRPGIRPLPSGVLADGANGRLHHGASAGHGAMGGPDADAAGVRESHQPESPGQSSREPGALSDERGSQARGGRSVCERCSQPVVPKGLGTAAKPAFEPIVVARKPLIGTVAATVQAYGTGALNIDGCRIGYEGGDLAARTARTGSNAGNVYGSRNSVSLSGGELAAPNPAGRWPANVVLDEDQAAALDEQSGTLTTNAGTYRRDKGEAIGDRSAYQIDPAAGHVTSLGDSGGASRFFLTISPDVDEPPCDMRKNDVYDFAWCLTHDTTFPLGETCQFDQPPLPIDSLGSRFTYTAKADSGERITHNGTSHPTVKPLSLMRWLVRLVTPPGGLVLDPFAGSGTTVEACILEGFRCVAIEREADYLPLITQRINRRRDPIAYITAAGEDLGLFGDGAA